MDAKDHVEAIKLTLALSPIVREIDIVRERHLEDRGFFRARLRLRNEDFLEVAEFFIIRDDIAVTMEYRHQWMDATKTVLRRRWDNAPHYPDLPGAPHHVHIGDNSHVEQSEAMSIIALISLLERAIDKGAA